METLEDFKVTHCPRGNASVKLWEQLYGTLDPKMPAWGMPIPDSATGGTSCRLIWNNNVYQGALEYLNDRSVHTRHNDIIKHEELGKFFNLVCTNFRSWAAKHHVGWDSDDYVLVERENFKCLLTCNSSCGYVYAGVWEQE